MPWYDEAAYLNFRRTIFIIKPQIMSLRVLTPTCPQLARLFTPQGFPRVTFIVRQIPVASNGHVS